MKLTAEILERAGLNSQQIEAVLRLQSTRRPRLRRYTFRADDETVVKIARAFPEVTFAPVYRRRTSK